MRCFLARGQISSAEAARRRRCRRNGGGGKKKKMTEGRRCQVHLLDDRKLELLVQPKLLSKELLDLVASHFNLKEKEYFGIAFTDETGHLNWLQLDRRVLEHDFPKKSGLVVLYFCVRFYIESISYLKDNATIELFFLNAKSCIYKELIEVDSEVVFELAAYILQEAKGDFSRKRRGPQKPFALQFEMRTTQTDPHQAGPVFNSEGKQGRKHPASMKTPQPFALHR